MLGEDFVVGSVHQWRHVVVHGVCYRGGHCGLDVVVTGSLIRFLAGITISPTWVLNNLSCAPQPHLVLVGVEARHIIQRYMVFVSGRIVVDALGLASHARRLFRQRWTRVFSVWGWQECTADVEGAKRRDSLPCMVVSHIVDRLQDLIATVQHIGQALCTSRVRDDRHSSYGLALHLS